MPAGLKFALSMPILPEGCHPLASAGQPVMKNTKRQVLIVASESADFASLKSALARLCPDWALHAATSAPAAREQLENARFDVVFAAHRIPAGDGLGFLDSVLETSPQTIRFLAAPAPDQELVMKCVCGSHRLFTQPPGGEAIRDAVERAFEVEVWLANEKIRRAVAGMRSFPTLPTLYFRILKELESPNASIEKLAELIGNDLAIGTKIIQVVNSAFYGWQRQITDLTEAVHILGLETIKSLVLAIQAIVQMDKARPAHYSIEKLWRHSLAVANMARQIVRLETDDPALAGEAYTAGLLHDLGKLVLASNLQEQYKEAVAQAMQRQVPISEVESEILGATHGETAAYLVALWGLPKGVVEAIALHHTPQRCAEPKFSPLTAVHVANALEHEQKPDSDAPSPAALDLAYLARLGMVDRAEFWRANAGQRTAARRAPDSKATKPSPVPARTQAKPRRKLPRLRPGQNIRELAACFVGILLIVAAFCWLMNRSMQTPVRESPMRKSRTVAKPLPLPDLAVDAARSAEPPPANGETSR